ncbi:MAG: hypothetical protein LBT22_00610, partial [Peptococcaceae bacterium]|nr:hypothetical protein [Peptococcaceae bacterium]
VIYIFDHASKNKTVDPKPAYRKELLSDSNVIESPSGLYRAEKVPFFSEQTHRFMVVIKQMDEIIFSSTTTFRDRDTNLILWADDGTDTLWAYNSDTGTVVIVHSAGAWLEKRYADNKDDVVPQLLKELRPTVFD